jgi:hypothetical protein
MSTEERFEAFKTKASKIHNNKYDYSRFNYINAKTVGLIICPIHGDVYQTPEKHITKNAKGCQKCWHTEMSNCLKGVKKSVVKFKDKEKFLDKCHKKYGNKFEYDLTNYNGITKNEIVITCPVHGVFKSIPVNHVTANNKTGCYQCGMSRKAVSKTKDTEDFKKRIESVYGNIYQYPNINNVYKNRKSIITINCSIHGDFKKIAGKHLSGQGCFQCRVDEMVRTGILTGGYSNTVFDQLPWLPDAPAVLYYLKINNGELYKIGITRKHLHNRIAALKNKSNKFIKNICIVYVFELPLSKAFKIEQKVLKDQECNRVYHKWSTELFRQDIQDHLLKIIEDYDNKSTITN